MVPGLSLKRSAVGLAIAWRFRFSAAWQAQLANRRATRLWDADQTAQPRPVSRQVIRFAWHPHWRVQSLHCKHLRRRLQAYQPAPPLITRSGSPGSSIVYLYRIAVARMPVYARHHRDHKPGATAVCAYAWAQLNIRKCGYDAAINEPWKPRFWDSFAGAIRGAATHVNRVNRVQSGIFSLMARSGTRIDDKVNKPVVGSSVLHRPGPGMPEVRMMPYKS